MQPYGFDVGNSERGNVLKGLDLGVEGMRIGGQVRPVAWNILPHKWIFVCSKIFKVITLGINASATEMFTGTGKSFISKISFCVV